MFIIDQYVATNAFKGKQISLSSILSLPKSIIEYENWKKQQKVGIFKNSGNQSYSVSNHRSPKRKLWRSQIGSFKDNGFHSKYSEDSDTDSSRAAEEEKEIMSNSNNQFELFEGGFLKL